MSARDDAKKAAQALARLNLFAAIGELTENGLCPGSEPAALRQIRSICLRAAQAELKKYDAALAAVEKATK